MCRQNDESVVVKTKFKDTTSRNPYEDSRRERKDAKADKKRRKHERRKAKRQAQTDREG